jgi:hypothetical protein
MNYGDGTTMLHQLISAPIEQTYRIAHVSCLLPGVEPIDPALKGIPCNGRGPMG